SPRLSSGIGDRTWRVAALHRESGGAGAPRSARQAERGRRRVTSLHPPVEKPTTARTRVLLLVLMATGITYLDRVCISAAAPSITRDLGLSTIQMGFVFSVFALSYGLFEIPMGWLGDLWGQRKTMTRIVACWSVFTALTG